MSMPIGCRDCPGAGNDLFSCLIREHRLRLTSAAVPHAYGNQETIFHAGTPALAIYCVRSGSIKLFRRLGNGDELVVGVRGPGDLLGLQGVVAGAPYATTATTFDPSVVCAIPAEIFLGLVRENPMMGYRLLQLLTREFQLLEEQLVERTRDRVGKRTARFLLQQIQGAGNGSPLPLLIGISMNREEMAQIIGTTPETLSRTLRHFALEGILEVDRREIHVLDFNALLHLAE